LTNNITPTPAPKKNPTGAIIGGVVGAIGLMWLISSCTSNSPSNSSSSEAVQSEYATESERVAAEQAASAQAIADASSAAEAAARGDWDYSSDEDAMTGKTTKTARVTSTNTINLDAPYNGPQNGTLIIRNHPQYGHDVIVRIEQGQLLCGISDGCTLMVRFDDDAPVAFTALEPADNSSESLFISNYKRFTARLKTAKRVRIQLNIYQNGSQYLEFNTTGFDPSKL
jgi:hypothetical protein